MTVTINGVEIYYEVSGKGRPIILLHANGMTHRIFHRLARALAETFTVYALDSRGHGKSGKVKELNYRDMADDVIAFIHLFALKDVCLYGFSDGGIIALIAAAQEPGLIDKLIVSGANTSPDGTKDGWARLFKLMYAVTKDNKTKLMLEQPDITDKELELITADTLVLAGQYDLIKETHTKNIAAHIPGSELRIMKRQSHGSYIVYRTKLQPVITDFCSRRQQGGD